MSSDREFTEEEIREMGEKEFRKNFPSGWMELARYETLVLIIDTLLESNPSREFTVEEIASQSGSTAKSVEKYIGLLTSLGIIKNLPGRKPTRYSLNDKSPITQKLFELNLTVEKVKNNELPQSLDGQHRTLLNESDSNTFSQEPMRDSQPVEPRHAAVGAD